MKTKIVTEPKCISLVLDNGEKRKRDMDVVAQMVNYADSNAWMLVDIRLTKYRVPGPHACSIGADEYCAAYKPQNDEEAELVKRLVPKHQVQPDGEILWCTFEGIVKGTREVEGYRPTGWADFHDAGYFSKKDGLALIKDIQAVWEAHEGTDVPRIENPNAQPRISDVHFALYQAREEKEPTDAQAGDAPAP